NATTNSSSGGALTLAGGSTFSVNGTAGGGGTISILASTISVTGTTNVSLTANGVNNFAAGKITVRASDATNGDISVGNGTGQISLSANTGSSAVTTAFGGELFVYAGHNLTVNSGAFSSVESNGAGQGGPITLAAGTGSANNNGKITIAGTISSPGST